MKFRTILIIIILLMVLIIVPANRSIFKWLGMDQDSYGSVLQPTYDSEPTISGQMTLANTEDVPPVIALSSGFECLSERNPGDTQVSHRFALSCNATIALSTVSTQACA